MSTSIRTLLEQSTGEIRLLESHDYTSTELVREAAGDDGQCFQGTWIGGLTQTTYLGIPDTELVSPLKRATLMASHNHLHHRAHHRAHPDPDDALARAHAYTAAGADAIMIHSKAQEPDEVLAFLRGFRASDGATPLVVVPTAYAHTARAVLSAAGARLFIYANHLMRAKIKAAGDAADHLLAARPSLFTHDRELRACLEARNFACLLQKLAARAYRGDDDDPDHGVDETREHRLALARYAADNMRAAVQDLATGHLCGCEADERIVPVKVLLKINSRQVSVIA